MKAIDPVTLKRARRWCSDQFRKRRATTDRYGHPSGLALKVLKEAEAKFNLGTFGVEGWAWTMRTGVQYLNTGETYDMTVCCVTDAHTARFMVSSWGNLAERRERA